MLEDNKASDLGIESSVIVKIVESLIVPLVTELQFKIPFKGEKNIVLGSTWATYTSIHIVPEDKVMHWQYYKLQKNIERSYLIDWKILKECKWSGLEEKD